MKYSILAAATVAAFALAPMSASALTAGTIPAGTASNDGVGPVYGTATRDGWFGGQIFALGDFDLKIEYFGSEAGFDNKFFFAGVELFNTGGGNTWSGAPTDGTFAALGSTTVTVTAGLLDFHFGIDGDTPIVDNGSNPDGAFAPGVANFFATVVSNPAATVGTSIDLWLDDDGAGPDDNHDDMMIRLTADGGNLQIVPVPLGALLIGTAFLGAGAVRRFGSRKAA